MTRAAVLIDLDDEEQRRWLTQLIAKLDGQRTEGASPPAPSAVQAAMDTFGDDVETWAPGECPRHHREWNDKGRGKFCPVKDNSGPVNANGFCTLKPGVVWNGKRIP
jgi:hypothetical protein